jgi:catechol 2,3-dioxygenase-like lactoylglutathione lyase family enzyme
VFERVTIAAADLDASQAFYDTVLDALGAPCGELTLVQATAERPPTRHLHVGIAAPSQATIDAFWEAGTRAGHRDDGPPGPRPQYREDYYGAFLLDPDGNSIEAVRHGGMRDPGCVDHLWLRVADLAATRAWWCAFAPPAGLSMRADTTELVRWGGERGGSVTLIAGAPATEHAELGIALRSGPAQAGAALDPDGNRVELVHRPRS